MNHIPLNDLSRMDATEIEALTTLAGSVVSSGHFLGGPHTGELVHRISERVAGRPVVCVGNGTDALYLGLRTLGIGSGSRVATISNAGGYTTGASLRLGAIPVMVDSDPVTAQMSLDSLERVLDSRHVDAVVVTHLYGLVRGIEDIVTLCSQRGVPVLEDCAQAFGCVSESQQVGTFGDAATFSFYPTKNLGALGDAGAVALRSDALATKAQQIAQYGWRDRYVVTETGGFNSRIDELQAAFLNHRILNLDQENERRREIVLRYRRACRGGRTMIASDGPEFIAHLAVMLTDSRQSDQQALQAMGIGTGVHYPVLDHHQPAWVGMVENDGTPGADALVKRILTLPCFPTMTEEEVSRVESAVATLG